MKYEGACRNSTVISTHRLKANYFCTPAGHIFQPEKSQDKLKLLTVLWFVAFEFHRKKDWIDY